MKIRISLLMMLAFVGVSQQLSSMQIEMETPPVYPILEGDFTPYFKLLGIKPTARLTPEGIKIAHKKAIKSISEKDYFKKATELIVAKHRLEGLCFIRARSSKTYSKEIILRNKTGIFTENIWYSEKDPIDKLDCFYVVRDYNYQEIFKVLLMAGALINTGIFCLYRDRIESALEKFFKI